MKLFLVRNKSGINAKAEYNENTGEFIVLKGSTVSATVAHTDKFRGTKSIEKSRETTVQNGVVISDVVFRSASTAANFVTGSSTNGLTSWKNESGITLKEVLSGKQEA